MVKKYHKVKVINSSRKKLFNKDFFVVDTDFEPVLKTNVLTIKQDVNSPKYWVVLEDDCQFLGEFEANELSLFDIKEEIPTIKQVGGDHYQGFKIPPIEFVRKNELDFCTGSIIKYVCRYKKKGGLEDLQKAQHFLEYLMEDYQCKVSQAKS